MDEELEFNLDELDAVEANTENKLKVKNRFEKLSEKVILTSREKEELSKAKAELENEKANLVKERDFYKNFSSLSSKYPAASDFQDKIKEKVDLGYTEEDATLAVLAKEGKLPQYEPERPDVQVEGGSAPIQMIGDKSLSDMTPEEKLSALTEADRAGALTNAFRGK